ncbi:Ankyrin repeat domain-containing 50 [Fusarium acutatum]|uniref:Ankyrin repeat domain-containing 50 n=1 Tax=Fusarium acutatum TaxID=78861 RepID=A0A8H4JJV1_9HYPO|nr:Ankyrin repeat domain-containing 50 [Fusarium acutatum]
MAGTLDAAGLALAATELCRTLATGLYFLIREIRDASKDAEIMQGTLAALHIRLDQVRALFDANVPQSPLEKDFRDSIDRTLENIHQDLKSLTGKLQIDVILEAKGSKRLEAWYVLQRKFRSDDIRNIKERLAGSEELLQSHFEMLSIYISYKTRDEVTDFKAFLRPILEKLLIYATLTEERQRNQAAESRSIRQLQHVTDEHGASNTFPEDKSDPDYHDAFKTWKHKSKDMIMSIANVPWHQVSNSNYVPSVLDESRDGATIVEETNGVSPSSRLGPCLSRVEEIPDKPPEDATEGLIDWCKEQSYPVKVSNFRYDLIYETAPGALKGTAPIHQAIKTNNMAVLEKMLSRDCNIEVRLEDGSQDLTPFLLACSELNAVAVKLLLANGSKADATDRTGKTGLHLCQSSKFEGRRVAKLLLEDPKAKVLDVNAQDQFGMTATHIAARVGDVRMLKYLLLDQPGKKVADANAQQQDGSTPLMVALKSNIANKKQVMDVLLRCSDLSIFGQHKVSADKRIFDGCLGDFSTSGRGIVQSLQTTLSAIDGLQAQYRGFGVLTGLEEVFEEVFE